jgi:hypothetical protein
MPNYGEHLICVRIYPDSRASAPIVEETIEGGIQGAARPSSHTVLAVVDSPRTYVGGAGGCISASDPTGTGLAGRAVFALCLGRD